MAEEINVKNMKRALKILNLAKKGVSSSPFSLLFLDEIRLEEYRDKTEYEVIKDFMKQLNTRAIFAKWRQSYILNQDKIQPTAFDSQTAPNDVRNFPSCNPEKLQYSVASCIEDENVSDVDTATRVFDELVYSNQCPNVNLIILAAGNSGLKIANKLFEIINKNQDQKIYCVWGGESLGLVDVEYKEDKEIYHQKPIFIEELLKFKESVQLKHFSLGFVSGRAAVIRQELICGESMKVGESRVVKSSEVMGAVMESFPNTTFLGGFNLGLSIIYGNNSIGTETDVISNKIAVSLMIITYE